MGFLDFVTNSCRAVARGFGSLCESAGRALNIQPLQDFGTRTRARFSDSVVKVTEQVRNEPEYDSDSARVSEVIHLDDILCDFRDEIISDLSEIHQASQAIVKGYAAALKQDAGEKMKGYDVILDFSEVDKVVEDVTRSLQTASIALISRRVSLSDYECTSILGLPQGGAKEKKMETFSKARVNECIDTISAEIASGRERIDKKVMEVLSSKITDLERHAEQTRRELQSLVVAKGSDQTTREIAKAHTLFTVDACKVAGELVAYASNNVESV